LIKSLTKSEKGYFKKFAAKNAAGSKQNYIVLFDAVDSMNSYDEGLLKKKLKNDPLSRQLSVYKVYLFNLILKSLSQYGAFDNSTSRIKELLDYSKTLSSKALHKEALKQLKKAKELAYKFTNFTLLLDVLIAERNIITVLPDKNIREVRKQLYEEEIAVTEKLRKSFEYSWLSDQMVICVEQKGDFREEDKIKEMEQIISSPLMRTFSNANEHNMKFYYLHTHLFYNLGKNRLDEVRKLLLKEVELLEAESHFIDDNPKNYSSSLINLLLFSQMTNSRKDVRESVIKLNALRKKLKNKVSLQLELHILFHAANTEMLIYRNSCDMTRGRIAARKIETELPKYPNEVPQQLKAALLSNLCSFYFLDRKYEMSLSAVNRLLKETSVNFKSDINFFARIMQLVIHFELKNYDLLEYLAGSAANFFKSQKRAFKFENVLINFFRNIVKQNPAEFSGTFEELLFKLKKIPGDPEGYNLQSYFDFVSWAESRVSGRTLMEIIKTKR
jgi:hypothetical protein